MLGVIYLEEVIFANGELMVGLVVGQDLVIVDDRNEAELLGAAEECGDQGQDTDQDEATDHDVVAVVRQGVLLDLFTHTGLGLPANLVQSFLLFFGDAPRGTGRLGSRTLRLTLGCCTFHLRYFFFEFYFGMNELGALRF